ncbi:MAG: InlB B-repeat-containing protein [Verrucomicrobiia bacterium]
MKKTLTSILASVFAAGAVYGADIGTDRTDVWKTPSLETNKVVKVEWQPQNFFKEPYVSGKGKVFSQNLFNEFYNEGTNINLEAVPDEYYYFDGWTGQTNTTQNHLSIYLDKPYTNLVANFKPLKTQNNTPYEWYAKYGITNNFEHYDLNDTDGDGVVGKDEYVWGTNPADANSYPYFSIEKSTSGINLIIPKTSAGRIYTILEVDKVHSKDWKEVLSFEGQDSFIIVPLEIRSPTKFYKVGARGE